MIDGIRWIYKSVREWLNEVLVGLTEWKLRKAIASLLEKNLIRREQLFARHQEQEYRSFWWQPKNQTYYYSINYDELEKLIEKAESTGNIRIEESTKLSVEEFLDTKSCELSRNRTKNTNYKDRTKKQPAAAQPKNPLGEENPQSNKESSSNLSAEPSQIKQKSNSNQSNPHKEISSAKIDFIVNKNWSELIPLLNSTGVSINRTIKDLLKLYPAEEVENAIALVRARKREQHIPNPSGYFVSALKGDWGAKNLVSEESGDRDREIDRGAIFRHWYDLARELGYCSGQDIRDGEQWVCLSGSWEKWTDAVNRGYSLEYLKKIMKRNQGQ